MKTDYPEYRVDPVYAMPKPIAQSVAMAFGRQIRPILLGFERVRLRWLVPDGKGGLMPRPQSKQ